MPNETEATDPLSLNLYNYCNNNPTKYIDSSGNGPILALFGAAGILLLLALAGGATVNSASSAAASGADPIKDIQQLVDNAAQAVQTVYMLPTYIVAYFASKSITNPASAVAPTTPGYAAVSQAPSVTVQEQATFSYPACKSYDKPDNGDKTEVKAEDLVGAISTPASPPPPDPDKNPNKFNHRNKYLQQAQNKALRNAISELYRRSAEIGYGGTADMLRYEVDNGLHLRHLQKSFNIINNLNIILTQQPLSPSERKLTYQLLNDLYSAVKYAGF
mgnify:CR=1 FL=1